MVTEDTNPSLAIKKKKALLNTRANRQTRWPCWLHGIAVVSTLGVSTLDTKGHNLYLLEGQNFSGQTLCNYKHAIDFFLKLATHYKLLP